MAVNNVNKKSNGVHTPASMMPLLPLTIAVGAGMLFARYAAVGLIGALAAGIVLIFTAIFALSHRYIISALGFGAGCILGMAALPTTCPVPEGGEYLCSAVVKQASERNRGQRLLLSVDSVDGVKVSSFNMLAINDESENPIAPGYRMCFTGKIRAPKPMIDYPDQIDYDSIAQAQGVVAKVFLTEENIKYVVPAGGLKGFLMRWREDLKVLLAETGVKYDTWAFLCATVAGDPSALDPENRMQFSQAGLAHVLALSGLHVAIIVALGAILLLPLRLIVGRRAQSVVLLMLIWIYVGITGMSTSVVRASLMISLTLIAVSFNLRNSPLNALCVSALIIAVLDPAQVFTVGFALSFLAVAGILIFATHLTPGINRPLWIRYPIGLIAASVGATIFTAPVVAYCFHTFPIAFLPANIMAGPIVTFLVAGGACLAPVAAFGISWPWMADLLDKAYALLQQVTHTISGWDWARVDALYLHPLTPWMLLAAIALIVLWLRNRKYRHLIVAGALIAGCVVLAVTQPAMAGEGNYFLRQSRQTEVLLHRGDTVWLFTPAKGAVADESLSRHTALARDFMARRDIKIMALLPDTCRKPGIERYGQLLNINETKYWFDAGTANDKAAIPPGGINCYVACRNGKRDAVGLAVAAGADSVLISYDLSTRKRKRLIKELKQQGLTFRIIQ